MVPLEERVLFTQRVLESRKLLAFKALLAQGNEYPEIPEGVSDSDKVYYQIIQSIKNEDKNLFIEAYETKSRSKPKTAATAPFVNDDFLVFSILVGVFKFNIPHEWLSDIMAVRSENDITHTFKNIISDNFSSKSNILEVVLMFLSLTDRAKISDEILTQTYNKVANSFDLFAGRSDFQILCSLRCYDLAISLKTAAEGGEVSELRRFRKKFEVRTGYLTKFVMFIVFLVIIYAILKLPVYAPKATSLIEKYNYVFTLTGAMGFTLLGEQILPVKKFVKKILMQLLGYPKSLTSDYER